MSEYQTVRSVVEGLLREFPNPHLTSHRTDAAGFTAHGVRLACGRILNALIEAELASRQRHPSAHLRIATPAPEEVDALILRLEHLANDDGDDAA